MRPPSDELQILGVADHHQVEDAGILQGSPHQLAVHHRPAVVADRHRARCAQFAKFSQDLACQSLADGPHRIDLAGPLARLHGCG